MRNSLNVRNKIKSDSRKRIQRIQDVLFFQFQSCSAWNDGRMEFERKSLTLDYVHAKNRMSSMTCIVYYARYCKYLFKVQCADWTYLLWWFCWLESIVRVIEQLVSVNLQPKEASVANHHYPLVSCQCVSVTWSSSMASDYSPCRSDAFRWVGNSILRSEQWRYLQFSIFIFQRSRNWNGNFSRK